MEKTKKVYDFPFEKVKTQVATALRKNSNRGTVADLVGLSGLPNYQVQSVLPAIVDECRGRLQVTESGELLYEFPRGMSNQKIGPGAFWKRFGKSALKWTGKILAFLFKIWIVVMLVGYFLLFVFFLLLALLVAIGLSFAKRDDRDSDSGLGFYLVVRVFEFFVTIWLYSGDPEIRQSKKRKPFHKAVFDFVFGVEEKPEIREKVEKKAFISLVRKNKGSVTLEELIALTGKSRSEADAFVSRLMLEYEGEPQVTDSGTLHFFFPELLKTSTTEPNREYRLNEQELIPFTRNPASTNRWIVFLNGFNIVLALYFLGSYLAHALDGKDPIAFVYAVAVGFISVVMHLSVGQAETWVALVLGGIPAAYSAFFFGIPLFRRLRETAKNQLIKIKNFRRKLVSQVLARPLAIDLASVEPDSERNAPANPTKRPAIKEAFLRDLAGNRNVEVEESANGNSGTSPQYRYRIAEFDREKNDLEAVRQKIDVTKYSLGKVVFDTESKEI